MSFLVHNEKAKLLANALDRASTACLAVGVLGPLAAAFYSVSGFTSGFWPFVIGALTSKQVVPNLTEEEIKRLTEKHVKDVLDTLGLTEERIRAMPTGRNRP